MKFVQLLSICMIAKSSFCYKDDDDEEDYIVDMDAANLEKAIKENPFLFVEFTSPNCMYCQRIEPAYEDAARQMIKEESKVIKFARLDATVSEDLRRKYGIQSYPAFRLFRHEIPLYYDDKYQKNEFVKWLKDMTSPVYKILNNVEDATNLQKENNISIFGFFKDQDCVEAQLFKNLSYILEILSFAITSEPEVFQHYDIETDGIVLYKNFDDGKAIYHGVYDKEAVIHWLHVNSLPLVIELNQNTSGRIFGGKVKSHNMLFISKSSPNYESTVEAFKKSAAKFRGQIIFVTVNLDDGEEIQELIKLFGIEKHMAPLFRIVFFDEDMVKYKPENGDITEENVASFTQDYLEKKLKPYYLSQELPKDWNYGSVWTLVSSNFDEVTKHSGKNVLVVFCADWSKTCKEIEPTVIKLGDHYNKTADNHVIVARIDAMMNEFEDMKIEILPTIKLYVTHSDKVIEYDGNKSLQSLKRFIDSNGKEDAKKVDDEKEQTENRKEKDEL